MTKRMTKEDADRNRQALSMNGIERPRAKVLQAQIEAEGGLVRDYARSYVGYMKPDEKGYVDNEIGWDWVAHFIHHNLCNLGGDRRRAMMSLTLGDIASMWAKAAGGMCDVLDPDDGGTRMPDFKAREQAIRFVLALDGTDDGMMLAQTVKLDKHTRQQLSEAIGEEVNDG